MINDFLLDRVFKNEKDPKEWCVSFKGMDYEEWQPLSANDFIREVELKNSWNDVDPEIYEKALGTVGIDFASYDDPDEMWEDFLLAVKRTIDSWQQENQIITRR